MTIFKNYVVEEEEKVEAEEWRESSKGCFYGDDIVVIRRPEGKANEVQPHVITVNCPAKIGLASDLCHVIIMFGLNIVRSDINTDGKWCFIVFWVWGKDVKWGLLKSRLIQTCPPPMPFSIPTSFSTREEQPRAPQIFLLKFLSCDRSGLLHDVTKVLCDMEFETTVVKASPTPDGKVMGLFFLVDTRELMHTSKRRDDVINLLKLTIKDALMSCEIELVDAEMISCIEKWSYLRSKTMEEFFNRKARKVCLEGAMQRLKKVHVTVDNSTSPSHTIIRINCWHHKGLFYDVTGIMKDYDIQISHGRFNRSKRGGCDIELLLRQEDGNKLTDVSKRKSLLSCLRSKISTPLLVTLEKRDMDQELLVAIPMEQSGKRSLHVFHDITCVLKEWNICIFSVGTSSYHKADTKEDANCNGEWEVYRFLLSYSCSSLATCDIEAVVVKKLMGWD